MKYLFSTGSFLPLLLFSALPALAQPSSPDTASTLTLDSPKAESPNRFGVAWRMNFNIQVGFKNVGAFPANSSPGPATGGSFDRSYDDGFNRVDTTGNNHGTGYANTTWYWGYDSESQIIPNTGNPQSVVMHSSSSLGTDVGNRDDDMGSGFEFSYNRELIRREHWRLGLEAVFGFTELNIEDSAAATTTISQIADAYSVPASSSGQYLPPPNRTATAQGPGSVISSSPSRTTSISQGQVTGNRQFRADLYGFRFGPYFELPLGKKAAFDLSGGLALMYVTSDFRFNESTGVSGLSSFGSAAAGSQDELRAGGYVAGAFSYTFAPSWTVFAGAQFQDLGKYTQNEGGRQAVLDLSRAVFVTLGFSYSF